jgi:hypothetical protein
MPSLIKLDMESILVIELRIAHVDTGYFVRLTPAENSQYQFGKDELTLEMKQDI